MSREVGERFNAVAQTAGDNDKAEQRPPGSPPGVPWRSKFLWLASDPASARSTVATGHQNRLIAHPTSPGQMPVGTVQQKGYCNDDNDRSTGEIFGADLLSPADGARGFEPAHNRLRIRQQ